MITDAALPLLSVIAMLLQYHLRTTEADATLPRRTLPTVAMVDLLRLLLPSMTAMIEDLMSDIPLILLLVVEPELLPGFAMTTTEPRRLGTTITVVVRPRLLPRGTRTITLAAALRMWQPRDTGAVPKVPLLGLQAVRMSKAIPAVAAAGTFLETVILVPQGLAIILPLQRAMDEMDLLMLAATDGLERSLKPCLKTKKVLLYQGRLYVNVRNFYCLTSFHPMSTLVTPVECKYLRAYYMYKKLVTYAPAILYKACLSPDSSTSARSIPCLFLRSAFGVSNSTIRPASRTMILSASIIVCNL